MFDELYKEILLEHYRHPRNSSALDHISDELIHENPTCGDSIKVDVTIDSDRIISVEHFTKGCAICTASASLMSELLKDKSTNQAEIEINTFIGIMRGEVPLEVLDDYGDMICLAGVVKMPVRIKCATLAWHAVLENISTKLSKIEKVPVLEKKNHIN